VPYEQGLSDWRVYSAEQAVGHDRDLTIEECRQLVEDAVATAWWREWFSNTAPINVVEGGYETPELDLRSSYAQPQSYPRADRWTISLHPGMLTARVLPHELAHCVAPHYVTEDIGPRRRNGQLIVISHRKHLTHGPFFTAALAVITDNLLPGDNGELAAALTHFEAPTASRDELRVELGAQPTIVADEEAYYAELRESLSDNGAQHDEPVKPREARIPPYHWGFDLFHCRRVHYRRMNGRPFAATRRSSDLRGRTLHRAAHLATRTLTATSRRRSATQARHVRGHRRWARPDLDSLQPPAHPMGLWRHHDRRSPNAQLRLGKPG
jgi:hypothetical protein